MLVPRRPAAAAVAVPGHHRQRRGRDRRQRLGPQQIGAVVAAVLRRRRRRGHPAVRLAAAVRRGAGAGRLRPDPARRAGRTLRLHRPGHGDPGDLHHDRDGPAPRRRHRCGLARRGADAGRRGVVWRAVDPVDGDVRQPAGARAAGAAVRRARALPAAQGGPVRTGAPRRPRGAAAGAGRAERARGRGAQRGQDRDPQPLRPLRAPRGAVRAVFPPVLHGAGFPRTRQLLALSLRSADRGVFPQRRAVPLPAPAVAAGRRLHGAGPGHPPAPAVRLRRAQPPGRAGPGALAAVPARPAQPALAAPARLAAAAGDQPVQHRAAVVRGVAGRHATGGHRHPPARFLAAHPARDGHPPAPGADARLGAVPPWRAHRAGADRRVRRAQAGAPEQRLLDPAHHRVRVPAALRRDPAAAGAAHRRHPVRAGRDLGADAAVPGHHRAAAAGTGRGAAVLRHPHRPLRDRHRRDHHHGAAVLQPARRRLRADLAAAAGHADRLRDRRRRLAADPARLAGAAPAPGDGAGDRHQRPLPGRGTGPVPQRHARRPALPHRPPRHAQRRRRAVGGAVQHAARAGLRARQPGCGVPLPGAVQHPARLPVRARRAPCARDGDRRSAGQPCTAVPATGAGRTVGRTRRAAAGAGGRGR